jgi:Acetyltransferase (GNAT) domain
MPSSTAQKPRDLTVELLTPEQLTSWDALVAKSPHGTIFHNSWWLEATGHDFQVLGCWNRDGQLQGGIPLPRKKRAGLSLYHPPALTPYLGPVFDVSGCGSVRDELYLMRSQGEALAKRIAGFDSFSQIAGTAAPDLQGFLWAGFHVEVGYTFRFDAGTTSDQAWHEAARTHRQKLKPERAEAIVVDTTDDVSVLIELNRSTFSRQDRSVPYSEDMVRSLFQAAFQRESCKLYVARDLDARPLSSLLVVNDARASYQIVSGIDWNEGNSSAGHMTTWRAIQDALQAGRAFDFEGSRIRGVEQYYRRWGAPAKPTWAMRKLGSLRGRLGTLFVNGWNGRN